MSKCLTLTEYTYDYYEFAKIIAVAPLGPDGKSALIDRYHQVNHSNLPLFLNTDDRAKVEDGRNHYTIEEVDFLTGESE